MVCPRYPKIDTLYTRDEKFKVTDELRRPEFAVPGKWLVTEKIHGCNIRVSLENIGGFTGGAEGYEDPDKWVVQINGRNDNSQIPPNLLRHLQDAFTLEGLKHLWRGKAGCDGCGGDGWFEPADLPCSCYDPYPITLYGEGYGGGIQKGGGEYTSKTKGGAVNFRLFDVLVGETWLRRADVEDVAKKLGLRAVPLLGWDMPLFAVVDMVEGGLTSAVAYQEGTDGHQAEGVVAFTDEPLYNNRGQRLMFKLKVEDFA